jgi:hypothetical protein
MPLSNLINLIVLDLSDNSISDLAPLVANTGLGEGDQVDVENNPLSATSINVHIPALQRRGVDVSFGASKLAASKKKRDLHPAITWRFTGTGAEAGGFTYPAGIEDRKEVFSRKLRPLTGVGK